MPHWLAKVPIAHRGLHDGNQKVCENSLTAAKNAIAKGHAIEMDLQWTKDGVPMVFHDYDLNRMTGRKGNLRDLTSEELGTIQLGNTADTIPTLQQLLQLVDGKVGLVLELKGEKEKDEGFVKAVIDRLRDYAGNVALMSFDHHLLRDARDRQNALPATIPLGLVAEGKSDEELDTHRAIATEIAADFVSYHVNDLPNTFIEGFRALKKPVICWTVRSEEQLHIAQQYCDQPTYELMALE